MDECLPLLKAATVQGKAEGWASLISKTECSQNPENCRFMARSMIMILMKMESHILCQFKILREWIFYARS
jgi:hypothetical protein